MLLLVLLILILVLFGGLGIASHLLWIVAVAALLAIIFCALTGRF